MRLGARSVRLFLLPLLMLLGACDIESVATGSWDVETLTDSGTESSVWTVADTGSISIQGGRVAILEGSAVLEGSRISWSGSMPDPDAAGAILPVNFNGTVDRNSLQGTLFTTLGNWSVTGSRQ